MNYVNYGLLFLVAMFGCVWVFNHLSAWGGIGLGFVILYAIVWKTIKFIKEATDEKVKKY